MTYADGEALILTQIRNLTAFDANNAARGIYTKLNEGSSKSYAILRPGPFRHEQKGGGGSYVTVWTTYCELCVKLKDYGETLDELVDRRHEIIDRFDKYPHAGNEAVVEDLNVISGADLVEIRTAGPVYVKQVLTIEWREVNSVTLQE